MIRVGLGDISNMKIGSDDAQKAYQGSNLVWSRGPEYQSLTIVYTVNILDSGKPLAIANTVPSGATMTVDGVQMPASTTYTFDTYGDHTIVWDGITGSTTTPGSNHTFSDCSAITAVYLPNTLTDIRSNMFSGCNKLRGIDMSNTLITNIYSNAFQGCSYLRNILFSPYTTSISPYAFYNIMNVSGQLCDITFPSGLVEIGEYAFSHCTYLRQVDFSNCTNLTTIDDNAFSNCSQLTNLTLPSTLTYLGNSAFYDCERLRGAADYYQTGYAYLEIPTGITHLNDSVFSYIGRNADVKTVIRPHSGITSVGNAAFTFSNVILDFEAPLQSVGFAAFRGVEFMSDVEIAADASPLGVSCFNECTIPNGLKFLGPDCSTGSTSDICIASGQSNNIFAYYGSIIYPEDITFSILVPYCWSTEYTNIIRTWEDASGHHSDYVDKIIAY